MRARLLPAAGQRRLAPEMRSFRIESLHAVHKVIADALLELEQLADARIDADVREQRTHKRSIYAEAVVLGDFRQGVSRFIEEARALLLEFLVRQILDAVEPAQELLVQRRVGNKRLSMGGCRILFEVLRDVLVHKLARRGRKVRVLRKVAAFKIRRDVRAGFH